jgi:hypothetical protein
MSQAAEQFKPRLSFDGDDRAEGDDTVDVATEFYRQANEYYIAPSDEEPEDSRAVVRMAPNVYRPQVWRNGPASHPEPTPVYHPEQSPVYRAEATPVYHREPSPMYRVDAMPVYHAEPRSARPRNVRRARQPLPRNHYRVGHVIARLFTGLGWLAIAAGIGVALVSLVPEFSAHYGLFGILAGSMGAMSLGLVTLAMGHAARAVFDLANAAREQVASQHSRMASEQF